MWSIGEIVTYEKDTVVVCIALWNLCSDLKPENVLLDEIGQSAVRQLRPAPSVNQFSASVTRGPSSNTFVLEERGLGPRNEKVLTGIELGRRTLGTEIAHLTTRERF